MLRDNYDVRLFCLFSILLMLLASIPAIASINLTIASTHNIAETKPEQLTLPLVDLTTVEPQQLDHARSSRAARPGEIEDNDDISNATIISSYPTDITGQINPKSDKDWFQFKASVQEENGKLKNVQNITIKFPLPSINPNPLTGDTDYFLGIFVYGWFDLNQDAKVNSDAELVFMKMQRYRIGVSIAPELYINAFNDGIYFFRLETDGGLATYHFRFEAIFEAPVDLDQDIKYSQQFYTETQYRVDMGTDTFDWFFYKKTYFSPDAIGLNFSISFKIDEYSSMSPVTLPDGSPMYFVTVLHVLVYHENNMEANNPIFPWQYRDHLRLSRQSVTKLKYEMEYTDIITLPSSLFKWTYIGFYVESYGVNPNKPGLKYYPIIPEMVEFAQNTFCTFTILSSVLEEIKRPELSSVSVISTTTNNIHGRTYDDYLYTLIFSQENNNPPLNTQLSVFTTEGEFIENMDAEIDPNVHPNDRFKVGCKYKATISGLLLGEGDHHVFQFHFKDKNTYAKGTIELGKTWHGPFISNNIRPYVRPTAPTELVLYEDDETTFFDLNTVFEDVDLKELLNFTLTDPATPEADRVWGKSYSDSVLDATIVNDTRLKLELKPNANGDVKILFNVTDKKHYYLDPTFEFTIRVIPINDPPQIIQYFSYIILAEDEVNTDINLAEYFVDLIDHDELTYRAANYININIEIAEDSNVKMTPTPNWHGTEYIDFYASDGEEEVTDFLKVIVRPVNDVPILAINQTIELWEDTWANLTLNVSDAADNEAITIMHNLTQLFPDLNRKPSRYGYTFNNETGYLTLLPTNDFVGIFSWNISAIDVHNELNFTHVTLIINNINDPPVPNILFPDTGSRYLTTDKVSLRGEAHDPDSQLKEADFVWYSRIEGITKKLGTGLSLPSQLFQNGTHKIILSVRDEDFISNTSITMHVFSINSDLDSDDDGIPDYWENLYNFNIKDPHDANDDPDKDTFSNWEEFMADTDPRDPKSMPKKHISKEKKSEKDDLSVYYGGFIFLVILLALLLAFIVVRSQRKKRKEKEAKELESGSKDGELTMAQLLQQKTYGKYKPPTVICHRCGKSLKIMTLNRPVAVRCTDCGARGAVY